jgi:hypothetical protein
VALMGKEWNMLIPWCTSNLPAAPDQSELLPEVLPSYW